jgi:hypothetical protein
MRLFSRLIALAIGTPTRTAASAALLIYVAIRALGWGFLAIVLAGTVWEIVKYPGRRPSLWRAR